MKYQTLFLLTMLLFSLQSNAQRNDRAITLSHDSNNNGDYIVVAENTDYCDYHFIPSNDIVLSTSKRGIPAKIGRGKTTLMVFDKTSNSLDRGFESYKTLRGNVNAKINLDYIYPLPIKGGDSIRFSPANNSHYTSIFNMQHTNDTVYASRSGILCNSQLSDNSAISNRRDERIIVYHKDGSFSEYSSFDKSLVQPGDKVEVGQAIAVVANDERGRKKLHFSVYFLDKNKLQNKSSNVHSAIVPSFHTANAGDIKLEQKTTYQSELTDELMMQDMSKKEKKNFLKKMEKRK